MRVELRLSVVDAPFRDECNKIVSIEIDGIGVGCLPVDLTPTEDLPRARAEKVLAFHAGESVFKLPIDDADCGKNLFGKSPSHDGKFGLVHVPTPASAFSSDALVCV